MNDSRMPLIVLMDRARVHAWVAAFGASQWDVHMVCNDARALETMRSFTPDERRLTATLVAQQCPDPQRALTACRDAMASAQSELAATVARREGTK
jgi:Cdc6-like AAA superfamily ATPase